MEGKQENLLMPENPQTNKKGKNEHSAPNQLGTGEEFEEVGFAYNKAIIGDLLRGELGFKGYVNTDTGITTSMP
jgi:beta-glucosidase